MKLSTHTFFYQVLKGTPNGLPLVWSNPRAAGQPEHGGDLRRRRLHEDPLRGPERFHPEREIRREAHQRRNVPAKHCDGAIQEGKSLTMMSGLRGVGRGCTSKFDALIYYIYALISEIKCKYSENLKQTGNMS